MIYRYNTVSLGIRPEVPEKIRKPHLTRWLLEHFWAEVVFDQDLWLLTATFCVIFIHCSSRLRVGLLFPTLFCRPARSTVSDDLTRI